MEGPEEKSRPGGASASPLAVLNVRVWLPIVVGPGAQFPRGQTSPGSPARGGTSLRDVRSRLREVHRARRTGASRPLAYCKPAAHHVVNRIIGVPWRLAPRTRPGGPGPRPAARPVLVKDGRAGRPPRLVRGAPRPFAASRVTVGPDRRFRSFQYIRRVDRWEVRMPDCVVSGIIVDTEGRQEDSRREDGGGWAIARRPRQRINETAFRRVCGPGGARPYGGEDGRGW